MRLNSNKGKLASALVVLAVMLAVAGCKKAKIDPFPASGAVAGWQKTSQTRVFAAKNLWQYIDGEAEQYIKAGVVSASTSDYKYEGKLEAVVDVYTMKNAAGAKKMFGTSSESKGARIVHLGDAGVAYAQSVSFRKGPYLVHIVAYEDTPNTPQALMALAHKVEAKL